MESTMSTWLRSVVVVLLGAALLLPTPGSTRALSDTGEKDLVTEQDVVTAISQGTQAMDLLEEGKASREVEPGIKVSSSAWAQAEPEEDRDHLYHPQDDAREVDVHEPLQMLSLEVQNSLEEDWDHLHHS
ncbi:uncharacterized protein LJ264_005515 [Porphyrio hochstetteri]